MTLSLYINRKRCDKRYKIIIAAYTIIFFMDRNICVIYLGSNFRLLKPRPRSRAVYVHTAQKFYIVQYIA